MRPTRELGASAVEYGLLLAAIAAVITVAVFSFGSITGALYRSSTTCISSHGTTGC